MKEIAEMARAFSRFDERLTELKNEYIAKTGSLLEIADALVEEIGSAGMEEVEKIKCKLEEAKNRMVREIEAEYKKLLEEKIMEIDEVAQKNFEKAVEITYQAFLGGIK